MTDVRLLAGTAAATLALTAPGGMAAAQQYGTLYTVTGHIYRPPVVEATEERVDTLTLPEGFELSVFAEGLSGPRMMAVADDGAVYVTQPHAGNVIVLRDEDGDGEADGEPEVVASGLGRLPHGVAIRDGRIYLATVYGVHRAEIREDGSLGPVETIIDSLPDPGQHALRTLGFSPDGTLHIGVGSSCNACDETSELKAANLRAEPDGSGLEVHASGLRNTEGFDWHPATGQMWGVDQNTDWRGDEIPPHELNRIERGKHYGWPMCYGHQEPDYLTFVEPPGGMSKEAFCAERTTGMVLGFEAHSSLIDILFYDAERFPEAYRGDAFITQHGSWNRRHPVGYQVIRVRFDADGEPTGYEDFLTGFLIDEGDGPKTFGRPAGLALAKDGSLLISDDANGVIYRVSHTGGGGGGSPQARSAP